MTAAAQAPGDGHRAAASDAVLRRKLTALGAMARRVAERAEVDLAVSGLKPDWPPKDRDRWYLPGGRCPQDRAVAARVVLTASRQNTRPSAGPQKDFGSDEPESACKPSVFLGTADDRPAASPESVRPYADAQADCARKKTWKCRPFPKRLMGFEPTTFCMASRRSSQLSYSRARASV